MSNIIWDSSPEPIEPEMYVDMDPAESREVFTAADLGLSSCGVAKAHQFFNEEMERKLGDSGMVADIIAACGRLRATEPAPDTVVFLGGRPILQMRVKGNSTQKKRARFINRKVKARLNVMLEASKAG